MAGAGYYTKSIGKDHFGWDKELKQGIPHGYLVQSHRTINIPGALVDRLGFQDTKLYDGLTEEFDNYDQWFAKVDPGGNPMVCSLQGGLYLLLSGFVKFLVT